LFIYKVCKVLLKFVGFAFELILSLSLFMYEYVIEFIFILPLNLLGCEIVCCV
jgi:hypothetical protein